MRSHLRNATYFVAGGLLFALLVGGAAHAITDTVFKYSSVKTGYYGLSPLKFVPDDYQDAAGYADVFAGGFQFLQLANGNTSGCFATGVNLPQGAKVTSFSMWYSSDQVDGVGTSLVRAALTDGADDVIATLDSTNASQTRTQRTKAIPDSVIVTIDNGHFVYSTTVCLNSANQQSRYYAGRIGYTYSNAGD
jgi:hypothetical protein